MHHSLRSVAALSCLGWVTMFGLHGCSGRLGPVRATQNAGGPDRPNLPDIFVEQARECVAEYAQQLAPGRVALRSTVNVDEEGHKVASSINGIPNTAPDLGACLRNVLHGLPIAEQPLRDGANALSYARKHANDSEDAFIHFMETIPGVPMLRSELVLEVDGYTVELDVNVHVVPKMQNVIDDDKRTIEKLGKLALSSLGYEEIMKRAEQMDFVKTVRRDPQHSPAKKALVGDAATAVAEFGRVMGQGLVWAGISSQVDTPAPGIGDAIGLGIIAAALLYGGALAVNELLTATATTTTTATPTATTTPTPTATTTTTAAPTTTTTSPPVALPRRWPGQTCENTVLDRLQEEKNKLCNGGFASICPKDPLKKDEYAKIPCSAILLSIVQRKACLAARWAVQDKCFGGKPDARHEKPLEETQDGINNCEAFKLINCAKDHPMAGK